MANQMLMDLDQTLNGEEIETFGDWQEDGLDDPGPLRIGDLDDTWYNDNVEAQIPTPNLHPSSHETRLVDSGQFTFNDLEAWLWDDTIPKPTNLDLPPSSPKSDDLGIPHLNLDTIEFDELNTILPNLNFHLDQPPITEIQEGWIPWNKFPHI
jgi:hypothetical protein